mgnify:CR=1 FL=1
MGVLKGKTTNKNLLKKGFVKTEGDHHFFEFWHKGVLVSKTRTSHNDQDIYEGLINAMSKQCKMSTSFFKEFAKCTKSKADYLKELSKAKII